MNANNHLMQILQISFEVLHDAIEITDFPLPFYAKKLALESRNRSLSRLAAVIHQVENELMEARCHCSK